MVEARTRESEQPVEGWRWAGSWVRDQSFWRDVTTRTLAILISGLIIYVLSITLGYVQRPDIRPLALSISITVLFAVGLWYFLIGTPKAQARRSRRSQRIRLHIVMGAASVLTMVMLTWSQYLLIRS